MTFVGYQLRSQSDHPRRDPARRLPQFLLSLLACLVANAAADAQPPGMPPAPVYVSKAIKITQADSKSFVGSLVPIRKSTVGSAVDGRVTKIFVDEGDSVQMDPSGKTGPDGEVLGQPMIQLRTVALDIELEAAKVELETRKMAEAELQQSIPAEIESAEAAVEEIKARLQYSKDNYDRLKDLARNDGVARRELEEASSLFQSQSQLLVVSETLLERLKTTQDEKLSQAKLRVDAQLAEIRRLEEQKFEYTIRAPFAGFVTQKTTELGQWVKRGDDVIEIIQLDPIELIVPVPQAYIRQLQESMNNAKQKDGLVDATVTVESVSGNVEGEVVQIVPDANLLSRSFPVKIRIKNPKSGDGYLLKSGMLASAKMFVGPPADMLLVHEDALVLGGNATSIFVVRMDNKTKQEVAIPVPVTTGAEIENMMHVRPVVEGAVKEGDRIVVRGNERLMPNQPVQVVKELAVESLDN